MKLLRDILKAGTLSTALFIFQACYGVPKDFGAEYEEVSLYVFSSSGKTPLQGISVSQKNGGDWIDCGKTAEDGTLTVYTTLQSGMEFLFTDPSGKYGSLDTTLFAESGVHDIPLRVVR